jgi:hypothetical protein
LLNSIFAVLSVVALPVAAQEEQVEQVEQEEQVENIGTTVGLNAEIGRSDNIGRSATDEVESDIASLGLDFRTVTERTRFRGAAAGDIRFRTYSADIVADDDDELVGSIDGIAAVDLVRDRFSWLFVGNYGQTRQNALQADSPQNRQGATVLSTGPQVALPLGTLNILRLSAQKSWRTFEDTSEFDSQATVARIGLARALSPVSQLGIDLSRTEVEVDDSDGEYEIDSYFLTYNKRLASGGVQLWAGEGRVSIADQSTSSEIFNANWSREFGAYSRFSIIASKQFTDAGELFRLGINAGTSGVGGFGAVGGPGAALPDVVDITNARLRDVLLDPNPFERSDLVFRYDLTQPTATTSISLGASTDRFEQDDALDNDGTYLQFSHRRNLGRLWNFLLSMQLARREFLVAPREDDDFRGRITVGREFGSRSRVDFSYEKNKRNERRNDVGSFDENVFSIAYYFQLVR